MTSLIILVGVLCAVGLAIYGVQSYLPAPVAIKNLICAAFVLIAILYLLGVVGVLPYERVHL